MMNFPTVEALIVTALFLVPGYLWSAVESQLAPRRTAEGQVRIIEFLARSCLNHALWFWLLGLLFATGFSKAHPGWTGLLLIVPALLSPVALGVITGLTYQRDWLRTSLGRFGFRTIHQIPTGWDYFFSKAKPCWIIVTLKDGSNIYGFFGPNSFASDDPKERDLYLESIYRPRADGEWLPVDGSAGILVKADDIAAIEFRKLE